jgi:hypothetical protein
VSGLFSCLHSGATTGGQILSANLVPVPRRPSSIPQTLVLTHNHGRTWLRIVLRSWLSSHNRLNTIDLTSTMEPHDQDHDSDGQPRVRRKKMTSKQLERKRKVDRENQRAIRYCAFRTLDFAYSSHTEQERKPALKSWRASFAALRNSCAHLRPS